VTTVLDTGNIPPLILQLRAAVAAGTVLGPRIYCVGPLLDGADPAWPPLSVAVVSKYQVPHIVEQLKSENVDLVKLYVGLSDPLVRAISDEAKKQNLRTIIDQWRRNGSTDLMDDDISGFAHLPFHRISDAAIQHAKSKDIFFISTLVVQESATRRRFRDPSFLDDPLIADVTPPSQLNILRATAGRPLGPAELETSKALDLDFPGAESNVKRMWDAGILIAAGTDAAYPGDFQGEGLHRELELLVESGLTPLQAITAATKNAAAIVNASQEWGTLEPGKLANLLLIDGKPDQHIHDTHKITLLMKQGTIIDRNKLKFTSTSKDFASIPGVSAE
jgi:imidazolonepropionase-like amidohydrolase